MYLSAGDHVVYCSSEVCTYEGTEKRSFDGKHEDIYFKLVPLSSSGSAYYVPADKAEEKIRSLISKDEVKSIIDDIPEIKTVWYMDSSERKQIFHSMLKSDDYRKVICLIKSIKEKRSFLFSQGRRLSTADETAMRAAETKICEEFSAVLNLPLEKVKSYINVKCCSDA